MGGWPPTTMIAAMDPLPAAGVDAEIPAMDCPGAEAPTAESTAMPTAAASTPDTAMMRIAVDFDAVITTDANGQVAPGEAFKAMRKLNMIEADHRQGAFPKAGGHLHLVETAVNVSPEQQALLDDPQAQALLKRLDPGSLSVMDQLEWRQALLEQAPDLYIASDSKRAMAAAGLAAVSMVPSDKRRGFIPSDADAETSKPMSMAFDGDKVFVHRQDDDLAHESIKRHGVEHGIDVWRRWQRMHADENPGEGPLAGFMKKAVDLKNVVGRDRLRVNVVTARGYDTAARVDHVLDGMGVRKDLDAVIYACGMPKAGGLWQGLAVDGSAEVDMAFDDAGKNFIDPYHDNAVMAHAALVPVPDDHEAFAL